MGQIIAVCFVRRVRLTGRDDRHGPGLQPRAKPDDFLISPELRALVASHRGGAKG